MLKCYFAVFMLFLSYPHIAFSSDKDIQLPSIDLAQVASPLSQALERRIGARRFDNRSIPYAQIAWLLWAGYGMADHDGNAFHDLSAVSGATLKSRLTVPSAWGKEYLIIYLLLKNDTYQYLPQNHKLKYISKIDLTSQCGANVSGFYGVFLIAADCDKMPGKQLRTNVAYMSAGAVAQNLCLAGTVYSIGMNVQTEFKKKILISKLELRDNIIPLALVPFGYLARLK